VKHLGRQINQLERQAEHGDFQPADRTIDKDLHVSRVPSPSAEWSQPATSSGAIIAATAAKIKARSRA